MPKMLNQNRVVLVVLRVAKKKHVVSNRPILFPAVKQHLKKIPAIAVLRATVVSVVKSRRR
jgi:hypothetical protein